MENGVLGIPFHFAREHLGGIHCFHQGSYCRPRLGYPLLGEGFRVGALGIVIHGVRGFSLIWGSGFSGLAVRVGCPGFKGLGADCLRSSQHQFLSLQPSKEP